MKIFLALTLLLSIEAFAEGKNCSNRPDQLTGVSNIQKALCQKLIDAGYDGREYNCHKVGGLNAAWYQDRDNSMSPANDRAGKSMAIVKTAYGYVQGTQICKGWYAAPAHVTLDDPRIAKTEGRETRSPSKNGLAVIPYPMKVENILRVSSDKQFISPRINNDEAWDDPSTDYVLFKVDNPLPGREEDYIRPLIASTSEIVDTTESNRIDVHLYRPRSRFRTDSKGNPDYNRETWATDINDVVKLYDQPQKIKQECFMDTSTRNGYTTTDCPGEDSVSGSPMVTTIGSKQYLMGMLTRAVDTNPDSYENTRGGNSMINSAQLCKDYEKACGVPCNTLEEMLPKSEQTVSL